MLFLNKPTLRYKKMPFVMFITSELPSDFLDNLLGTARPRSPRQTAAAAPRMSTEESRPPVDEDSLPCKNYQNLRLPRPCYG